MANKIGLARQVSQEGRGRKVPRPSAFALQPVLVSNAPQLG